jgi:uncharacterized coiled-coil protein SlyX
MASQPLPVQKARLAQLTRERFVVEMGRAMDDLALAVQERLTTLLNEAAPSREMQSRRDAWTAYQRERVAWVNGTRQHWQDALKPPVAAPKKSPLNGGLELLGTEVVENKILAARFVMAVMEGLTAEFNDLRVRLRVLEGQPEPDSPDILHPDTLILILVEQWTRAAMPREAWFLVTDVAQQLLAHRLKQAFANCNEFLIKQGVLPTIELADRVRHVPPAASRPRSAEPGGVSTPAASHEGKPNAPVSGIAGASGGERSGWGAPSSASSSGSGALRPGQREVSGHSGRASHASGAQQGDFGAAHDETRMMTSATPLSRVRQRAQGVLGQLRRLLVGSGGTDFEATHFQPPTPALAQAIAVRPSVAGTTGGGDDLLVDASPSGVAQVASALRQQTAELKTKAHTKSEKATIEIVALMFQAILQEDRIPSAIRVWFARLQMPVLRVALSEPDFFGTLNHPARQLIDRMGSCVLGFDASGIHGSALETEIKRVVQVIEQYPETGRRVYELLHEEFKKFLTHFLTDTAAAQKVVGVAQQVEQKETLTIQYTIEMRNMLRDMPVRDEIREFLFKVWAEVLAVAAVRHGAQHEETLGLKKSATDLVWAASAKPNRTDRARVIQDLPQLLHKLRAGMSMLGISSAEQEKHIKTVSDTLADAFMSKTQAIDNEQIQAMAERLANLEDFVGDDGTEDLPLDSQSIEMMLGIDASQIDVVADGGSKPTAAMLAWAQELELGSWFSLDHNSRVAQVQFVWRSERKHLHLFASVDGRSYLIQAGRLAAYLQAGLLLPQEEETLTVRATRDALVKLEANPERLFE